jgi:hypothetical protein
VARSPFVITDPGDPIFHGITTRRAEGLGDLAAYLPQDVHADSPRPDTPRPAVEEMAKAAKLPDALMGGNRRMRTAEWLPREEEEEETAHAVRLSRSTCFPFYKDTLLDLASRPFPRDLSWEQEPPEQLAEFLRDVDGTGKSLTVLARDSLLRGMHRGMEHVLVDASSQSGANAAATAQRRVYAQRIDPLCMFDIRDVADADGRKRVTYCRFLMHVLKDTDTFKQERECVIVELEKKIGAAPGSKVEWRFDRTSKKWIAGPKTAYDPGPNGIPLFTLYTNQTGAYEAEPLLEDLAWVNLAHFQSRSDHAHVMRIARLITLVTLGFSDEGKGSPGANKFGDRIVLGPLSRINSPRPPKDASVSFLEPSGKSIELSFQDMEQLSDECKRLGARHLTSKTGNVTARAVTLDDAKSVNNLQTFCLRLEVFLRQILEAVADWLNAGALGAKVQPRVHKEFQVTGNLEGGARALTAIAPALSKRNLLVEGVRYGILRADFPVDENLAELKEEQEAMDAAIAAAAGTPGGHDHAEPDDEPADRGGEAA